MNIIESKITSSRVKGRLRLAADMLATEKLQGKEDACCTLGDYSGDGVTGLQLPLSALHEIQAQHIKDFPNAAAFSLLFAMRAEQAERPLIWISEKRTRQGRLYPPGLSELGIDPDAILQVQAPDMRTALQVAADAARSAAMSAVILSVSGKRPRGLDLTATRRLSLLARESGQPVFLLRDSGDPMPSTAWSRWEIASAPSNALAANAPGNPVFNVKLIRHRGGKEGVSTLLEWDRETRKFAAYTRPVPAIPVFREDFAGARKRA